MSEHITLKRGKRPQKAKPTRSRTSRRKQTSKRQYVGPALALGAAIVAIFSAWLYQLPDKLWLAAAHGVADAGFEVRSVDVTGLHHMTRLPVYTAALDGASDSMLLVDLEDIRERLKLLPWVADASVGRKLPDTLVVDIVERQPAALWQYQGRHALVDANGYVLTRHKLERFGKLPLLVGEGANVEARAFAAMMKDYPAVSKHVSGAIWVGGRRWDLRLKSGETLSLPENYAEARKALDIFVRIDRDSGLVDKGFSRFDLRLPDKMVVRVAGKNESVKLPKLGTEI